MPGKDHNNYSASDIARYHRGEMSAAERHALEKAALDDPFLADAIEGYAFSKSPELELSALSAALNEKTEKERAGVFFMAHSKRNTALKIAAMFILLAGLGLMIVRSVSNEKTNDIAIVPSQKPENTSVPEAVKPRSFDSAVEKSASDTKDELVHQEKAPGSVQSVATATASPAKNAASGAVSRNDDLKDYRKPAAGKNAGQTIVTDELATTDKASKQVAESKTEEKVDALAATPERRMTPPVALNNVTEIKGIVTNESGQPLPYASVTVNGTRNRALTDKEGNFNLKITDSTALLSANAAGYEVAFVPVNNAANNVIVLKESAALSEVVVTDKAQGRKKAPAKLIVETGDLEPEEGWVLYNEYVEAKLKPIETNTKSKERREVSLTFDVNENGEPINITVENSQCVQCNKEAIRLLKEGPKWKKGKKGKISFRF